MFGFVVKELYLLSELFKRCLIVPFVLPASGIHGEASDKIISLGLLDILVRISGRVIWNSWPTGVAVTWAMHHGGPYPASTNSLFTSVGADSIKRFRRPVVFQNMPTELLPTELK